MSFSSVGKRSRIALRFHIFTSSTGFAAQKAKQRRSVSPIASDLVNFNAREREVSTETRGTRDNLLCTQYLKTLHPSLPPHALHGKRSASIEGGGKRRANACSNGRRNGWRRKHVRMIRTYPPPRTFVRDFNLAAKSWTLFYCMQRWCERKTSTRAAGVGDMKSVREWDARFLSSDGLSKKRLLYRDARR